MSKATEAERAAMCDLENENGVFPSGYYYIMTLTFAFLGKLEGVTAMTFILSDTSVVFDTNEFEPFFMTGKGNVERLTNSPRTILDRAGCALHKMPAAFDKMKGL